MESRALEKALLCGDSDLGSSAALRHYITPHHSTMAPNPPPPHCISHRTASHYFTLYHPGSRQFIQSYRIPSSPTLNIISSTTTLLHHPFSHTHHITYPIISPTPLYWGIHPPTTLFYSFYIATHTTPPHPPTP